MGCQKTLFSHFPRSYTLVQPRNPPRDPTRPIHRTITHQTRLSNAAFATPLFFLHPYPVLWPPHGADTCARLPRPPPRPNGAPAC